MTRRNKQGCTNNFNLATHHYTKLERAMRIITQTHNQNSQTTLYKCPRTIKYYIIVVTRALVFCLICTPSSLGPAALGIRVYISGRTLVPVLQLLIIQYTHTYICMHSLVLVVRNTKNKPLLQSLDILLVTPVLTKMGGLNLSTFAII